MARAEPRERWVPELQMALPLLYYSSELPQSRETERLREQRTEWGLWQTGQHSYIRNSGFASVTSKQWKMSLLKQLFVDAHYSERSNKGQTDVYHILWEAQISSVTGVERDLVGVFCQKEEIQDSWCLKTERKRSLEPLAWLLLVRYQFDQRYRWCSGFGS